MNVKQLESEKKEKVWDGKGPSREKRTGELPYVICGREAGLGPETLADVELSEQEMGGENLSSCPLAYVSQTERGKAGRQMRRGGCGPFLC